METIAEREQIISDRIIFLVKTYARRLVRRSLLRKMCSVEEKSSTRDEILSVEEKLVSMARSSLVEEMLILNINRNELYKMIKSSMLKKLESYDGDVSDEMMLMIKEDISKMSIEEIIPVFH